MPTTINASNTSGGAVVTGDGSGVLELQSGGVTGITVNGANVTVAGTLTATGGIPVSELTGTLPVAKGGTGATTLAANNVLIGNGTSAVSAVAPGTAGNLLTSNGTAWTSAAAPAGSEIVRVARTSNTQIGVSNRSNLIDITSGTFTQTFVAAATLGSGWFCYIENSGTGDITLDPNGSETIDGLTSYIMYPGEARLVQCDGTGFNTIVLNAFTKIFTTTTTFTRPPGYKLFSGLLWAGGGSGSAFSSRCGGGGGGACVPFNIDFSSMGASQTVTIGAGGTSISPAGGSNGIVGGTSQIGTLIFAYGGGGGGAVTGCGGGGGGSLSAGATGANTDNFGGQPTSYVSGTVQTYSNAGFGGGSVRDATACGNSFYGGGGGGTANTTSGSSVYGGAGGAGSDNGGTFYGAGTTRFGGAGGSTNGAAGTAPGGGGAAGFNVNSGAGARGQCNIWGIF